MTNLEFDPKTSAFIVIDLQNGILARECAPYSTGDVVKTCASLAGALRAKGATIVYVHVDMNNFIQLKADSPSRDPKAPPPPPEASEFAPNIGKLEGDIVITKRHWSAFPRTELEKTLRARGVDTVILGGIATNFGVESTAREAAGLGFNVIFAEDAMSSMSAQGHRFATDMIFPRLGRVRKSSEIIAAL
jgi:nicotinamidase-related amidase